MSTTEISSKPAEMPAVKQITAAERRRYLSLNDFEEAARRRLPPMLYNYICEGVETNAALRHNRSVFSDYALVPRVLMDVSARSQAVTLFEHRYAAPFGIAPMGGTGVCAYRGDLALGCAATAANIPMVVSAASVIPLEEIQRACPHAWFQAYLPADHDRIEPMVDRVAAANFRTLVLTADVPVGSNREHYVRSGFSIPLRPSARLIWQGATHPAWLFGTALKTIANHGMPLFENMDATPGPPFLSRLSTRVLGRRDALSWKSVELIRRRWQGNFVLKGILSSEDARIARESGVDGIIVSNHGGRQLDTATAALRVLPQIVEQAKGMKVILDGGIRRGTDVLKALALGADFVLVGRPFLYAAVAGGDPFVRHAIGLLKEEVDRDMALLGVRDIDSVSPEALVRIFS
jgi:L-lactate dehydrogenase (cytochrome)